MSKLIHVTTGKFAIVDDKNYDWLIQFYWRLTNSGYAYTLIDRRITYMHRLIMNCPDNMQVDHINHIKLDNIENNLRLCTSSQNHMNNSKSDNCTSIFKGVHWCKRDRKWYARIKLNGKPIQLGLYDDEYEAAGAYDMAAIYLFQEFQNLNFKREDYSYKDIAEFLDNLMYPKAKEYKPYYDKRKNKYESKFMKNKIHYFCGYHDTKEEALEAHNKKKQELENN